MRWIWIDKFLEFRSGQFARAIKNLTLAEEHLHDHFPGYPGDAGLADHRGAGPDRRDPGRRGRRLRREGGAGQDPPRRVLRRGLRGRPAHLRGDAHRPAERGGRRRGQGVPRTASCSPTPRSSSPTWTTPGPTRSSAPRISCSPSSCSACSTWPRRSSAPRGRLGGRRHARVERTASRRTEPDRRAVRGAGMAPETPESDRTWMSWTVAKNLSVASSLCRRARPSKQ